MTETLEFQGERFHIAERVGLMPMMRFAVFAKKQMRQQAEGHESTGEDEIESLAAAYQLLEQCLHPVDWERFVDHATLVHADMDEMMEFVGEVMAVVASRPTGRSADSSDGPQITEPSLPAVSSSDRVIHRLNDKGRGDLALLVRKRQESLSA
jgi:hypothetical protein